MLQIFDEAAVCCFYLLDSSSSACWLSSTEDLWDCLEQASGKPIAAVMGSWTKQMGFPIIEVDQEQVSFTGHKLFNQPPD